MVHLIMKDLHPFMQSLTEDNRGSGLLSKFRDLISKNAYRDGRFVTGVVSTIRTSPNYQIIVKLDEGDGAEYIAYPPTVMPTSNSAGGFFSNPKTSQRFVGYLPPNSSVVQILSYTYFPDDRGPLGVPLQEEELDSGDTAIRGGGSNSPAIIMKGRGKMTFDVGMNVKQIFDKATGKITSIAKQTVQSTLGQWNSSELTKLDPTAPLYAPNSTTSTWIQRKTVDSNTDTDEFELTEDPVRVAAAPYVDKAIIKAGHLVGTTVPEDLGHVYELRTQQGRYGSLPMTPATGMSALTELRLGKQNRQTQYQRISAGGSIISLKGKDTLGPDDNTITPDPQTFILRWGQFIEDDNLVNKVKGENFALRSLYGGMFATGPGDGWSYKEEENAAQVMSISSGKVSGTAGLDPADYDSTFYRFRAKHLTPNASPSLGVDYKMYLGESFDSDVDGITSTIMKRTVDELTASSKTTFNEIAATGGTLYRRQFKTGDPTWATSTELIGELSTTGYVEKFTASSTANTSLSILETGGTINFTNATDSSTLSLESDKGQIEIVSGANTYLLTMTGGKVIIESKGSAATDNASVEITPGGITLNPGLTGLINLGGTGMEQQLVTKSWIDMVFATHMHPSAAPGPPTPPVPMPMPGNGAPTAADSPVNCVTHSTKGE